MRYYGSTIGARITRTRYAACNRRVAECTPRLDRYVRQVGEVLREALPTAVTCAGRSERQAKTLVKIAESDKAIDAARVSACVALLDRGWGKPHKTHHHDGDIRQHIISDRPLTLDEWTAKYCRA